MTRAPPPAPQGWVSLPLVASCCAPEITSHNGELHAFPTGSVTHLVSLQYADRTTDWAYAPAAPHADLYRSVASLDESIYLIGGGRNDSVADETARVDIYDPDARKWTQGAGMPTPRGDVVSVPIAGELGDASILVIGGGGGTPDGAIADQRRVCERYTPSTDRWTDCADLPQYDGYVIGGSNAAAASVDGRVYAFAPGGTTQPLDLALVYDPDDDTWRELPRMPERISAAKAAAIGDTIYIVGGRVDGEPSDRTLAFDTLTETYTEAEPLPAPLEPTAVLSIAGCLYALPVDEPALRWCP